MNLTEIFAKSVKRIRLEKGISQEELADRANLHRTYINLIERNKRNITIQNVEKIAIGLGVEPYILFIDESNKK